MASRVDMYEYTADRGGGTFVASTVNTARRATGEPFTPAGGYAVVLHGNRDAGSHARPYGPGMLAGMVHRLREAFPDAPYIGTWIDEHGRVFVDAVAILPDRASAEMIGRAFGQLAIWDVARAAEIRL